MTREQFRKTPEGFCVLSAVSGVFLAALLAQTRVLAFASFQAMTLMFLSTDAALYISMKLGIIRSPGDWGKPKT